MILGFTFSPVTFFACFHPFTYVITFLCRFWATHYTFYFSYLITLHLSLIKSFFLLRWPTSHTPWHWGMNIRWPAHGTTMTCSLACCLCKGLIIDFERDHDEWGGILHFRFTQPRRLSLARDPATRGKRGLAGVPKMPDGLSWQTREHIMQQDWAVEAMHLGFVYDFMHLLFLQLMFFISTKYDIWRLGCTWIYWGLQLSPVQLSISRNSASNGHFFQTWYNNLIYYIFIYFISWFFMFDN